MSGADAAQDDEDAPLDAEQVVPAAPLELDPRLAGRLDDLQRGVGDVLREVRRSASFVDELHAENQRLRQGEVQTVMAPLVRDVAALHDDVVRLAFDASDDVAEILELLRRQVVGVLERQGVVAVDPPAGAPLDPAQHQVVGVAATDDPHLDRTVAAVRRTGFTHPGGRVVRPADVDVHRYRPEA